MITVTSTGTKATRIMGVLAIVGMAWLLLFGLVLSPADEVQGEAVRMLYIHVPTAWLAFLAFGITALGSALYLFPKTRSLAWDRMAGASAEIGVLYTTDLRASGIILLVVAALVTTAGLAATSTLFGALSAGVRVRETLLPLLLIPTVTPVLIGATRAYEAALGTGGASTSEGWPWVGLLGVFALAYGAFGLLGFGALMEEA